jgi:amidase
MIEMFRRGNPFQRLNERKKSRFVAAFLLAFVLVLSSVIVALPGTTMAVAQQAPPPYPPADGDGGTTSAVDDTSKALTKEDGDNGDDKKFEIIEATIPGIHDAIKAGDITCTDLVQQYIDRAKAYNGVCTQLVTEDGEPVPAATGAVRTGSALEFPTETVPASDILPNLDQYIGLPLDLGRMEPTASDPSVQQQYGARVGIPDAGQLNALETLNIRGERSVTCKGEYDAHPSTGPLPEGAPEECEEFRQQPDALERAAELDAQYGSNPPLDELPMYCIPFALKDWYDAKDMRSTSGHDVNFAMDVPPEDSPLVAQLREKGAIIYASAVAGIGGLLPGGTGPVAATPKFNSGGLFGGVFSSWGGATCNSYDTTRAPGGTSGGSGAAVSANLVTCAICEQTAGSCRNPASTEAVVSLLGTKGLNPDGGAHVQFINADRGGILCRTLGDAALVLDALKGYDSRDIYTAIPEALISKEPFASFVVDDGGGNNTSLAGMRIGIVSDHLVKPTLNDAAIVDSAMNEFKTILRDKLGAEIVESFDPKYPGVFTGITDDPDIPNMTYTFQDAIAETLARHMPEYFHTTNRTGDLEFAVPGWNVTTKDYMVALAVGEAPLSENLNIRRLLTGEPPTLGGQFTVAKNLAERGDTRVSDWDSFVANAKWFSDATRVNAESSVSIQDIRAEGKDERVKMSAVLNLMINRVMYENNLDALVNVRTTIPITKILGPGEPAITAGRQGSITDRGGFPEIIIPGPFNQIEYEPQFALNATKTGYITVTGTEQSLLPRPLPVGIMFWGSQGTEPTLLKVASAYEAATHHRTPPPDFGPLSDDESFPIQHMSNTTASAGYGVYAQKPARAEYVTNSSELVGDEIDSITLRMKSVGTINGTAEIGVLNEDLSVKKLFGTLDVDTLTPTYTDYEFSLTGDELYQIEEGDRIGIKYEGGGFDETSWVSVMLDLDAADPFDGANSYLQYHYQGSWRQSPDRDLHAVLVQTHG